MVFFTISMLKKKPPPHLINQHQQNTLQSNVSYYNFDLCVIKSTKELLRFYRIPFYFYNNTCLHQCLYKIINHVLFTFCIYKKKGGGQVQCPFLPFQSFFFIISNAYKKKAIRGSNFKTRVETWAVWIYIFCYIEEIIIKSIESCPCKLLRL